MKPLGTQRLSVFFARCAYGVCLLLIVLTFWQALSHQSSLLAQMLGGLVCGAVAVGLLWLAGKLSERLDWRLTLAGILVLCFVLRLFWVLRARIEPLGDYEVFHNIAAYMAEHTSLEGNRYLALFPHIMGYSWFLSLFYKLLGPSPMVAAVVNVGLSTLSCALLFFLGKKLWGRQGGTVAALVWTFFPSQIIYNMFVLSEPLYTALILGVLLTSAQFDARADAPSPKGAVGLGALAGLLAAATNLCRPVGAILLLCLLLWLGLVRLERWRGKAWRRNALCFLLALLVAYAAVGRAGRAYLDGRLGVSSASTPGYNILVGFNVQSGGLWNAEDSALLFEIDAQPGATAASTQAQMLERAKARVADPEMDFGKLFRDKLYNLMGRDDSCVGYADSALSRTEVLSALCNIYWYMALLLALSGVVLALVRGDRGGLFPAMLYFVGLILAHMLVEVAGRYHYSLTIPLCLLAAYGAAGIPKLAARLRAKEKSPQ